jgi:hypothetical protein
MNKYFLKVLGIKPNNAGYYKYNPCLWVITVLLTVYHGIKEGVDFFINSVKEITGK